MVDNEFPLVFYSNVSSITHRFQDNEANLQTENDVSLISPPGCALCACIVRFVLVLNSDPDFLMCSMVHLPLSRTISEIMRLQTGNDVVHVSLL